ncbi:2-dehydropantoate 2-reductase [Lapidilactobacillus gannanensis]|uniref:2-dehydropantoate 2-reductase n=1 Tax=Lapidilactobacillus gannanensis TaxID=2486002 RepID=A0ABW4BMI6_9LACO|nr:2-dehydropantoate 2-reductase [Lapidilactobacillus gannanensis]
MKIAIAGAGAMGSRFGVMLSRAGNQVILIDQWAAHVQAINEKGLTVDTETGSSQVKLPAYLPADVQEKPELVILFTKSMGLANMLAAIEPILGETTKIVCLLNGLGHVPTLEKYVRKENIFMGVTLWTAGLVGPGHVKLVGNGRVEVQNIDPAGETAAKEICDLFSQAGLNAVYSENVIFSIWRKACVNGTLNTLCTLLDCNIGEFGQLPQAASLLRQIIAEFALVAKATDQVTLTIEPVAQQIEALYDPKQAGLHYPSMYQDLILHHRLTEIDYLNGYVAKKAAELNLATPICQLLTELIHAKEALLVK